VNVHAYAVNRGEISLLQQRPDGWRPGRDVAGIVAVAAADGGGPKVGTRVVGIADGGGWSRRVAVPVYRVGRLPDAVSYSDAADWRDTVAAIDVLSQHATTGNVVLVVAGG